MSYYLTLAAQIIGIYLIGVMIFPFIWNLCADSVFGSPKEADEDDGIFVGFCWPAFLPIMIIAALFKLPKRIAGRAAVAGSHAKERLKEKKRRYITGQRQQEEKP